MGGTVIRLVALALLAAGCGGSTGGAEGVETETGSKDRASGSSVIKLAFLGPMTGEVASIGVAARDATRLAIDEANERGDLPVRLMLEEFDTQFDPAQAQALVLNAVTDSAIIGAVGPFSSGEVKAAAPTFEEGGLPFLTVATNPDLGRHGWKAFHRLVANDHTQSSEVARYIDTALKARTVSILHDNTEYGRGLAELTEAALRKRGVATEVDVIDPKSLDYSAAVNIVNARRPAAVFYSGYYAEAGRLVKQLRDAGITAPFLSGDAAKDPGIAEGAGKAAEGVVVTCACSDPAHHPDPAAQSFARTYQKRFGRLPKLYSAESYDGANLLIDAIRRGARTRGTLLANLNNTRLEGVTKTFSFLPGGEVGSDAVYVYAFRRGVFESLGTTADLVR